MSIDTRMTAYRNKRLSLGEPPVPDELQGVSKDKIRRVLARIKLDKNIDLIDCVFSLLDDETVSFFPNAPVGTRFCDGSTTAQIACHIGILQRGRGRLDREGRDYWIKPLAELGGIEPVLLHGEQFIYGHVVPKSGNSSYRLADEFQTILKSPDNTWPHLLDVWTSQDSARARKAFQAEMFELSKQMVETGHSDLIRSSVDHYAARFLPGYELIYIDDGDGDRITDEDRQKLAWAGVDLNLGGAMPDALLWNPETNRLWVIEAVTSDGEVDIHKVNQMTALMDRYGKSGIDFTTTYRTWKEAAARQGAHGNIAVGSFIWIQSDPAKHFRVETY